MKTITLKTDDHFFDKVAEMAQRLHMNKSELIRKAIVEYEKAMYCKEIKERMKKASMKVRGEGLEIEKLFEDTLDDGLKDV